MRYAVISDVHSNLEALTAVLEALAKQKFDQLLCAGDSVGYGADPALCLERLEKEAHRIICGNHDLAVTGGMDLDWFNPTARTALEWTRQALPETQRQYLKNLPLLWKDEQVTLVHSSLHEPQSFHYVLDLKAAADSLALQETAVAFIGHTHLPGVFLEENGKIIFARATSLRLSPSQKALVNVGSVGQPRDGDPRAAFCLYDSESGDLEIHRVPYPVEKAQEKIRRAGLPEFFAERLTHGF